MLHSTSSPMAWPSSSLISLKWSRSTNSRPTRLPLRLALAMACSRRSKNSRRLGRPVSGSWWARRSSSMRFSLSSLIWRRISSCMSRRLRARLPSSSWRPVGRGCRLRLRAKRAMAWPIWFSGRVRARASSRASNRVSTLRAMTICTLRCPSRCDSRRMCSSGMAMPSSSTLLGLRSSMRTRVKAAIRSGCLRVAGRRVSRFCASPSTRLRVSGSSSCSRYCGPCGLS